MIYYDSRKEMEIDEVLVYQDLWMAVHVWWDKTDNLRDLNSLHVVLFRILEIESKQIDQSTGEEMIFYPSQSISRPSPDGGTTDPRAAGDYIAQGFIKWDGCMEIEMDHHFCELKQVANFYECVANLYAYLQEKLGFEMLEKGDNLG